MRSLAGVVVCGRVEYDITVVRPIITPLKTVDIPLPRQQVYAASLTDPKKKPREITLNITTRIFTLATVLGKKFLAIATPLTPPS